MTRLTIVLLINLFLSCAISTTGDNRIIEIGRSIINFDASGTRKLNVSDVVYIGDRLIEKILLLKSRSKSYRFQVDRGDFKKPFGNGKADYILRIQTDFETIGIRLKYDKQLDKYHILGWATFSPTSRLGQNGSLHQLCVMLGDLEHSSFVF